jgi:hypothetical protein
MSMSWERTAELTRAVWRRVLDEPRGVPVPVSRARVDAAHAERTRAA